MLVQDVINASSTDCRQVLASTSPDSGLFVSWVDRIHKDALHTGIYNYLIAQMEPVSVVAGTAAYAIPTSNGNIRRINLVYDRTFDRIIFPINSIVYPTNLEDQSSPRQPLTIPKEMVDAETMTQYPKYFRLEASNTIYLFPAPQKTAFDGTYEVHYEMQVPDLTATTSSLLIPDDGIDQVVAGVNAYVMQFLHLDTEAGYWSQQYEALKKGSANQ